MARPKPSVVENPVAAVSPEIVDASVRVIRPTRSRVRVGDVWRHRAVIRTIAGRDMKVKFKQSLLGPIWLVFQPLALLIAFVVGFGSLAGADSSGAPYALFALVGLTAWSYFQITLNMGAASLVSNHHILRRTACPRLAFPIASLITNLPALAVPGCFAVATALILGQTTPRLVLLPVAVAWTIVLTGAMTLLLSAVAVRFRDAIAVLPFLLQLGLFVTPLGYSLTNLSGAARVLVALNPLTGLVEFWRWVVLSVDETDARVIGAAAVVTVLTMFLAWRVFARTEVSMADVI